jgi:hypothetical protein
MAPGRRRKLKVVVIVLIVITAVVLFTVVLPLHLQGLVVAPEGEPLATLDLRSGEPFQLQFTSDGQDPRVWLDLHCESCSYPVTGAMTLRSGKKTLLSTQIQAGDRRDRTWGGTTRTLRKLLLLVAPAQPAGATITISGTLTVGPARGNLSTLPVEGAPPPRVKLLRITVTP